MGKRISQPFTVPQAHVFRFEMATWADCVASIVGALAAGTGLLASVQNGSELSHFAGAPFRVPKTNISVTEEEVSSQATPAHGLPAVWEAKASGCRFWGPRMDVNVDGSSFV